MARTVSTGGLDLAEEARLFSMYLIGKTPNERHIERYIDIINTQGDVTYNIHDNFLAFVHKHPRSIPYLDAYLSFRHPYEELRYRIYIMFAVLESSPEFWQDFLPERKNVAYLPRVMIISTRAIARLAIGGVLAQFVRFRV